MFLWENLHLRWFSQEPTCLGESRRGSHENQPYKSMVFLPLNSPTVSVAAVGKGNLLQCESLIPLIFSSPNSRVLTDLYCTATTQQPNLVALTSNTKLAPQCRNIYGSSDCRERRIIRVRGTAHCPACNQNLLRRVRSAAALP